MLAYKRYSGENTSTTCNALQYSLWVSFVEVYSPNCHQATTVASSQIELVGTLHQPWETAGEGRGRCREQGRGNWDKRENDSRERHKNWMRNRSVSVPFHSSLPGGVGNLQRQPEQIVRYDGYQEHLSRGGTKTQNQTSSSSSGHSHHLYSTHTDSLQPHKMLIHNQFF